MSKITIVAIVTCSAAFIAAGALAYTVSFPNVSQDVTTTVLPYEGLIASVAPVPAVQVTAEAVAPIALPEILITSRLHPPQVPRAPRAILPTPRTEPRALSEMTCTGWRQLEQGGGRVRSCD